MTETVDEARARYMAAAHAMQSGVAAMMNYDETQTDLKHLRAGVNSALVTASALVDLLVTKGVVEEAECYSALADQMETERDDYAAQIGEHLKARTGRDDGPEVTLR